MIDGGIDIDLEAVLQNIAEAEVISLFFPTLRRALVVDTRRNDYAGTLVKVMPMARDGGDRLGTIRRMRPMFARPRSMTLIPWDGGVDSLVSLGVWESLLARIDDPVAAANCLARLRTRERAECRDAILGVKYQVLWSRERV
ncbi:MAG: hypothetical protein WD800_01000 [Dehalococcoidia bacterium]